MGSIAKSSLHIFLFVKINNKSTNLTLIKVFAKSKYLLYTTPFQSIKICNYPNQIQIKNTILEISLIPILVRNLLGF